MQDKKEQLLEKWKILEDKLTLHFGKQPDIEAILFLIGLQETGYIKKTISKEQKQDLMHVGVCTLLSPMGIYALEGRDSENWPYYKQLKPLPEYSTQEQELFLKEKILDYFEKNDY